MFVLMDTLFKKYSMLCWESILFLKNFRKQGVYYLLYFRAGQCFEYFRNSKTSKNEILSMTYPCYRHLTS